LLATSCASTGAVPRPFPVPGGGRASTPPPETGAPTLDGYALTSTALSLRGAPYRNGGMDPERGFDCSGFVQYVYARYGITMPRQTRDQFSLGKGIDRRKLEPGDLVFFTTVAPGASHVGISIGGDQFVHAPSERGVVRVDRLSQPYWSSRFVGARRLF
jgi:cell wall-associated NlpC family hydrolase